MDINDRGLGRSRTAPAPAPGPEPAIATTEAAVPKSQRRRRASTGGYHLKLNAPKRPGYVRRWVNDDAARILNMQELGYDFAQAETKTDGQGSRISRIVGKDARGEPQHAYLMETPDEEYALGMAEKEEQLKPFEQAIRAGRDTTGQLNDTYEPANRSSLSHTA
jgi:hypothetical protein